MRAYILKSRDEERIEPFGEYARDCLIGNKKLEKWQRDVFLLLGISITFVSDFREIGDQDEFLYLTDNLFFTEELVKEFLQKSRHLGELTTLSLLKGNTVLRIAMGSCKGRRFEYPFFYYPQKEFRGKDFRTILIDPDEFQESIRLPEHMCMGREYLIPMTDKFVISIDHWVKLWVANIVLILSRGAKLKKLSSFKKVMMALRSCSLNQWKILSHLNNIGSNCDIHPTAYVEGSTIGNNVKIGARAVVKESIIGNDVCIGNSVTIEESVVGDKSTILSGHILYCVFYPSVFSVAGMISASLIGRDSFLGVNATLTDFRFDQKNVEVFRDGSRIDSGNMFLGSCLGHGVYLGSGSIIAPGRVITNGLRLVPKKGIFCGNVHDEDNFKIIRR